MDKLRICKNCNQSEDNVKFQGKYRKICIKCNNKLNNERIKMENPSYFSLKMKERYIPRGKKVGRPKKILEIKNL